MTFKDELIEILKEELDVLHTLKELTYRKTDIIINNEVENLQNTTDEEEKFTNMLIMAENKRLKLMDSWGVNINITLSEVIENIPEGKEELIEIKQKLSGLFNDIKARNQINSELINDNLQWLDFNMNLISNAQTPTIYGNKDQGVGDNNSLFDRKV